MKTIFITAYQPFISRNILNTGVLDELFLKGARIILFVPTAKYEFYCQTYQMNGIVIEPLDLAGLGGKVELFFRYIAELLLNTKVKRIHRMRRFQKSHNVIKLIFEFFFTNLFAQRNWAIKFFRYFDLKYNKIDFFEVYIRKYNPDVVFAPNVFGVEDIFLLKSSHLHNIKSVGMVLSWDNNTTKHLMRHVPQTLLVQNEIIKNESITIHNIPENIITVVGIAHYDYYKSYKISPRKDFLNKIGVDASKRYIIFSPAGEKFVSFDWQICEILKTAFSQNLIPGDVVVVVRMHPTNPMDLNSFVPDEHFIIERPGIAFEGVRSKSRELDKAGLEHLINLLAHSELVINIVSSVVIDAAVFDKPIITIGFNGYEKKVPFMRSVDRHLSDENMETLLKTGGTRIVKNSVDLIDAINFYLINKDHNHEGRERIIHQQIWKLDGMAKTRIAESLISEYKE